MYPDKEDNTFFDLNDFDAFDNGLFEDSHAPPISNHEGFPSSPRERPDFGSRQVKNIAEIRDGMFFLLCRGGINDRGSIFRRTSCKIEVTKEPFRFNGSWLLEARLFMKSGIVFQQHIMLENISVIPCENGLWSAEQWIEVFNRDRTTAAPPRKEMSFYGEIRKTGGVATQTSRREIPRQEKSMPGFSFIGGQPRAKAEVQKLSVALNSPERYARWGTKAPRGICLFGPPGNGKTQLAKALAAETKVPFYSIDATKLMSKWHGESENNVNKAFEDARKTGGIIFFDEADALAPARSKDTFETDRRVIAALNRNMDGFESSDRVVVFFATNRPEDMDEAVLRPGRIDRMIEVPLPDKNGRREIFEIHVKRAEEIASRMLFEKLDIESLIERMESFSGADIAEVIRRTLEEKVLGEDRGENPGLVTSEDILRELNAYERKRVAGNRVGFGTEKKW